MNTEQIKNAMDYILKYSNNIHHFGVYAADLLPDIVQVPAIIITNTDPSSRSGKHWVAMFINNKRDCIYFDSFGRAPFVRFHIDFMVKNCKTYSFNTQIIQNITSEVCGHYCLIFLLFQVNNKSLYEFLSLFNNRLDKNDYLVKKMFELFFTEFSFLYHL